MTTECLRWSAKSHGRLLGNGVASGNGSPRLQQNFNDVGSNEAASTSEKYSGHLRRNQIVGFGMEGVALGASCFRLLFVV